MDRHALVVYDSRYGNTFRIAEALTRGLQQVAGLTASCHNASEVHGDLLEEADLIVIGGPTEYLSASQHIRDFFGRISGFDLKGKLGFAFDTHAPTPFSGSASRLIEKDLRRLGVVPLEPRHSALTRSVGTMAHGDGHIELAPEADAEFETIGRHLGEELLAWVSAHPKTAEGEP
jgi:flavodoxin